MFSKIPHYFRIVRQVYVKQKIDTFFSYIKAFYWGVNIGKGARFIGLPKFRKPPGADIKLGKNIRVLSSFTSNLHGLNRRTMISALTRESKIEIGNNVGMSGLIIACANSIRIGNRVMIGANSTISDTDSHAIDYKYRHPEYYGLKTPDFIEPIKTKEIQIEDDVFIGMHCLILKGSKIGKGSVIAAGSIVAGEIPANVIAAGQPAKVIKHLSELD